MSNMGRILPLASFVALFYARLRAVERTTATNPGPARFCPRGKWDPATNAHCAIVARALTLVVCVVYAKAPCRSREGGNPAPLQAPSPSGDLCLTHRAARIALEWESAGAMPHCRGRGGVPHKHTGRVGGKNYVRQAQLRKGLPRRRRKMRVRGIRNAT